MQQLTNKRSSLLRLTVRLFANDESTFFSTSTSPRCSHKQIFFSLEMIVQFHAGYNTTFAFFYFYYYYFCKVGEQPLHSFMPFLLPEAGSTGVLCHQLSPARWPQRGAVPCLSSSSHLKCTLAQTFRRHYARCLSSGCALRLT